MILSIHEPETFKQNDILTNDIRHAPETLKPNVILTNDIRYAPETLNQMCSQTNDFTQWRVIVLGSYICMHVCVSVCKCVYCIGVYIV